MSWKKVNKKEWLEKGLPESITYIGPFYEWNRKKKGFKKPVPMVTNINVNHLWETHVSQPILTYGCQNGNPGTR